MHRRSGGYALGFAVAAVALGGLLPQAYFTDNRPQLRPDGPGGHPAG
jgi:hypothetical protein